MSATQTFEMLPLPRMTARQKRVFSCLILYVIVTTLFDWIRMVSTRSIRSDRPSVS